MRILPIANQNVYVNSNRNNFATRNTNAKPSFSAHLSKDMLNKIDIKECEMEYFIPNKDGNLRIHNADLEEMQKIHKMFKDRPMILAEMHLTKNKNGMVPINIAKRREKLEIVDTIYNLAIDSNLDIETSIKLLETIYNIAINNDYIGMNKSIKLSLAINALKLQAAQEK